MPDTFHGRTTPKVREIYHWKQIKTFLAEGETPRVVGLDPFGATNIHVWSDIHFGHGNIIKYCNRPFPDRRLMDQCLMGNYQNVVKHDDIVIWGGDIGFMKEHDINHILNQLPGYKIQIVGNHDIHRDGRVYELAFNERHLCFVLNVEDVDFEYQLLFTHYPLDPTNVPDGCYNVHGHIHNHLVPGNKHINMCVEHTGYRPMNIKEVLKRTHKQEALRLGIPYMV
jgi:calcineurin-like phosphoesterase family protein